MSKIKTFDCVEMKNGIQTQMHIEFAGLSDAEVRQRINQELVSSKSITARKWKNILNSRSDEIIGEEDDGA